MSNVDGMAEIAKAFDRNLPAILDAAGPDCQVFVFAVHGMRHHVDYSAFGEQIVAVQAGRQPVDPETRPDLLRRVRNAIPDPVHRFLWRRLPARIRARRQHQISTGRADLSRDRLFPVVHDGQPAFRANLKGRERDGFVSAEEAEELFRELEGLAAGFRTASGVPAFPRIWRSAVEEPGPRSHRLPDVFLVSNPELQHATQLTGANGVVLSSTGVEVRDGVHTSNGFCFYRPAAGTTVTRRSIDNTDFGPSVLKLLGVDSSMKFDGTSFVS